MSGPVRVRLLGDTLNVIREACKATRDTPPTRPLATVLAGSLVDALDDDRLVLLIDGMTEPWPVPRRRMEAA